MADKNYVFTTVAMEYDSEFWAYMKNKNQELRYLSIGKAKEDEGYKIPDADGNKLQGLLREENAMRRICTIVDAMGSQYTILSKQCEDISSWVSEGEGIPIYEGIKDFSQTAMENHKLCSLVRFDEAFVMDTTFNFRDYLLKRFAKVFGRQEENAFICGDGDGKPTGILHPEHGAEVACEAQEISADDIITLFFSLKPEYRKKATWVMNDATALHLRKLKDDSGNYLWRSTDDSIFGRPVEISNYMPDMEAGAAPILFGDFSYYWIIRRSLPSFKALTESFAPYSLVGFVGTEHLDGKLVRREAVKAVKVTSA